MMFFIAETVVVTNTFLNSLAIYFICFYNNGCFFFLIHLMGIEIVTRVPN